MTLVTRKMGGGLFPGIFLRISGREFCGSRHLTLFPELPAVCLDVNLDHAGNVNRKDALHACSDRGASRERQTRRRDVAPHFAP